MKYLIPIVALGMAAAGCVIKKDAAASAAVSAEIATQLAKGFSDPSGAMGSMSGTSAAITSTCVSVTNGMRCTSGGYEMEIITVSGNISGYQKMTGVNINAGGKAYTVNGRIDMTGTTTGSAFTYNATTGQYTFSSKYTQTFNGTLKITGADNFDVEYKEFAVTVNISGSNASFSFSFSCGGKLVVDTIEFPVKSDCSI